MNLIHNFLKILDAILFAVNGFCSITFFIIDSFFIEIYSDIEQSFKLKSVEWEIFLFLVFDSLIIDAMLCYAHVYVYGGWSPSENKLHLLRIIVL